MHDRVRQEERIPWARVPAKAERHAEGDQQKERHAPRGLGRPLDPESGRVGFREFTLLATPDCSPFPAGPLDEGIISGRPRPFLSCFLAPRSTGEHREGLELPRRRSACGRDGPSPGDRCFRELPRRLSLTEHRRLRT
jgi:hypothetical protein